MPLIKTGEVKILNILCDNEAQRDEEEVRKAMVQAAEPSKEPVEQLKMRRG